MQKRPHRLFLPVLSFLSPYSQGRQEPYAKACPMVYIDEQPMNQPMSADVFQCLI